MDRLEKLIMELSEKIDTAMKYLKPADKDKVN